MPLNRIVPTALSAALVCLTMASTTVFSCSENAVQKIDVVDPDGGQPLQVAKQNLQRAISLVDVTMEKQFDPQTFEMRRFYNPFTKSKSEERASVWMYTAGIESVNAIIAGLKKAKDAGDPTIA